MRSENSYKSMVPVECIKVYAGTPSKKTGLVDFRLANM